MKISCNIIKDILPLYVEDLASEETRKIVEDHMDECNDCKNELEEMKSSNIPLMDTDTRPLEKIRSKMRRKKLQTIIFTTMIILLVAIIMMAFLTAPEYINDASSVSIVENSDGTVVAYFDERVTGFDINKYGSEYSITSYDSIWSRNFGKSKANNVVLNSEGENVETVFYFHTDGPLDKLIYGKNPYENGGQLTLPRLALSYYLTLAMGFAAICGVIARISRKNKKIRNIAIKIMLLPISYIIGHILIKGFKTTSYSMARDFYAILLAMIGVYAAILLAMNIIKNQLKTPSHRLK